MVATFSNKLNFPIVWKNSKFTHQATNERKETKESTDGRVLQIGKVCTNVFELYNTENVTIVILFYKALFQCSL
jgi:hypothetical protein